MAALPETAPIRDRRSRRLMVESSLGILLVVQSFWPPSLALPADRRSDYIAVCAFWRRSNFLGEILRFLAPVVALAAGAGATIPADAPPSGSLVAIASSLGQRALNDPAAFNFVESL